MTALVVTGREAGKVCPFCRFPLKVGEAAESCDGCNSLYHEDCWRDNHGCAILGCTSHRETAIRTAPPPPALGSPPSPTPTSVARRRRKAPWLIALVVLGIAAGAAAAAIILTRRSDHASLASDAQLQTHLITVSADQRTLNTLLQALAPTTPLTPLREAARALGQDTNGALTYAGTLTPAARQDRTTLAALTTALNHEHAYAQALATLPVKFTKPQAETVVDTARKTQTAFTILHTQSATLPQIPISTQLTTNLLNHASNPLPPPPPPPPTTGQNVGVPSTYQGRFTSVDRLERCNATLNYVYCSAGPSGKAVKLTVGEDVTDLGVRGSQDLGGASMPEGTSFTTPNGKITCNSSTRGITCMDTTNGAEFVIGDYQVIVKHPGSPNRSVGTPATYSGYFTAVDRLERCYANDSYVVCTAGPSGKGVRLVAGGSATYEGVTGSTDKGGPSMPEGTSFSTPQGSFTCGSSSRGITCTDNATGNSFTIGDTLVHVTNDNHEVTY